MVFSHSTQRSFYSRCFFLSKHKSFPETAAGSFIPQHPNTLPSLFTTFVLLATRLNDHSSYSLPKPLQGWGVARDKHLLRMLEALDSPQHCTTPQHTPKQEQQQFFKNAETTQDVLLASKTKHCLPLIPISEPLPNLPHHSISEHLTSILIFPFLVPLPAALTQIIWP